MGDQNVAWNNYVLETCSLLECDCAICLRATIPVCLCHSSTFILHTAHDHNRLILEIVHIGEGSMTLNKHGCINRHVQFAAQLGHTVGFVFTAAIGEKYEGNALRLEIREGLLSSR
jgi:hypothetical protein